MCGTETVVTGIIGVGASFEAHECVHKYCDILAGSTSVGIVLEFAA